MRQTISIKLDNRFGEVERIIGLLSGTGFKIIKMNLSESGAENLSNFVVVVDDRDRNIENMLVRLQQLIRVKSVECVEGDLLETVENAANA